MPKIEIGGQEFDTACPAECPGRQELFDQGGLCHRCPIFNCAGNPEHALLRPEDYRKDWARAWRKWFDEGMKGLPDLRF